MLEPTRWNLVTRIAFRLAFCYFIAFWLMRGDVYNPLLPMVGRLLGFGQPLNPQNTGSGDKPIDFAKFAVAIVAALSATVLWSIIDFRRQAYPRLWDLLRVFIRYYLASMLMSYGVSKVVPLQFPSLDGDRLVQQIGTMSPMGMLWTFMGASPAYTIFSGLMELLAALLLLFRRTATLGALLTACIMGNIFMLNMCYDVPVKLYSLNYLVLALILAAPDLKMLLTAAVLRKPVIPSAPWVPFQRRWINVVAHAGKGVVLLIIVSGMCFNAVRSYRMWNAPAPKDYGVWRVEEFISGGTPVPPLLTDGNRWRRLCFGAFGNVSIHTMTGQIFYTQLQENGQDVLKLQLPAFVKGKREIELTRQDPEPGVMVLSGEWNGAPVSVRLKRILVEDFPLNKVRFHWVSEYPANF